MAKVSSPLSNDYCPQTLFVYGTYDASGKADFGLFCWFSYYNDNGLGVMACIGGEKLTKEHIHQTRVFSANLVTESILPLCDYFGTADGHDPDKMRVNAPLEKGQKLNVPVLRDSPLAYELEVERFIPLNGGEVMLCRIKNVLLDAALADPKLPLSEKMALIRPVSTTQQTYFGWDGRALGAWHSLAKDVQKQD